MLGCKLIETQKHHDARGNLDVLEYDNELPFNVQRVFYMTKTIGNRGGHANKNSKFVFLVVQGSVTIIAKSATEVSEIRLEACKDNALFIDKLIWKDMSNFSDNCILVVLSDCVYDEGEYLRTEDGYSSYLKHL